ncbi:hypothetical protein ABL78_4810 [Leptomonas seymouri]|uniref:Uncharacterized protein n=1 Tax=Leptomonas seymouri TaxID=5684 RepID=A0A0N1HXP3_LEPSE|nr:hypothetical protein ABL78_4810 [Leptomonas seymouri]|eukprot:KPI86118.1 hypothetical protein ABL78_4810 [Leptomonas seymouri]
MLRRGTLRRCGTAAAQTLTAWLSRLAEQAEALPELPGGGAATSVAASAVAATSSSSPPSTAASSCSTAAAVQLFRDIEEAVAHANALRETDTLFSVLHCLLRKRYYPADVGAWARLAERLLPFGGIEAGSVLHYPGQPKAARRRDEPSAYTSGASSAWLATSTSTSFGSDSPKSYCLPVTREMLLMTGGVVPLSARVPCGDGRMVALFLGNFIQFVRGCDGGVGGDDSPCRTTPHRQGGLSPEVEAAVRSVSQAVLQALKVNASTLQWELLLPSLLDYLRLLQELDLQSAALSLRGSRETVAQGAGADEGNSEGETVETEQRTRFLQRMMDGLAHAVLVGGAHGARVVVHYLNDIFAEVVEGFQSTGCFLQLSNEDAQFLYWVQQRYLISLTRSCMRAVYLHYTPSSAVQAQHARRPSTSSDLILASPINSKIQSLYDQIDVVFQQNTNAGNPLHMHEAAIAQLKDIHTLALLRALRIEEAAPDAYLRRALEVVDRVPASMAIEGELIAGKARLLDLDSDTVDEDGRTAVYNDLLASLRSLVEMRPRFSQQDGVELPSTAAATGSDAEVDDRGGRGSMNEWADLGEDEGSASAVLDAATQGILQRAHGDVITAFCSAHKDEWTNEAYNILVTHKYNGVKITKELILPVLEVFCRRGDCRAFNLVDLCVLYSNQSVDMNTIALLFRTCAAAGDRYRAQTFLQLLNDVIPGFLVKCPASVRESLQELKLLDPPPRHLFVSAEDDLVQSALGEETRMVRRLPDAA